MNGNTKFRDHRSGRVVFISQCIANQNLRFPGIAVASGACEELLSMLIRSGAGIETIPCLERIGWGGVSRGQYFKYQPLLLSRHNVLISWMLRLFTRLWLWNYGRVCGREASRIVSHIEDYIRHGYVIAGIISMNDSPTDGVTQTIDLLRSAEKIRSGTYDAAGLLSADITRMRELIPALCERGEGIFMKRLRVKLERRGMGINIIGFDPWVDQRLEAERIMKLLDMHN